MTLEDAQHTEMLALIEELRTENKALRDSLVALSTINNELATSNVELRVESLKPNLVRRYNLLVVYMLFNHPDELTYIQNLADRPTKS